MYMYAVWFLFILCITNACILCANTKSLGICLSDLPPPSQIVLLSAAPEIGHTFVPCGVLDSFTKLLTLQLEMYLHVHT